MKNYPFTILLLMMVFIGTAYNLVKKQSGQEPLKAVKTIVTSTKCVPTLKNPCCSPDGKCGQEVEFWCAQVPPTCPTGMKAIKQKCSNALQSACP